MIRLDATLKSNLNWDPEIEKAQAIAESGSKITWELDFGLFGHLLHPLSQQKQFQNFCLGVEHFQQTIWTQFADSTSKVLLYRGPLDEIPFILSKYGQNEFQAWLETYTPKQAEKLAEQESKFLKSLFCRDIALDFLKQLAAQLPFGATPHIEPHLNGNFTPVEQAIFFHEESFKPFELEKDDKFHSIAICLPAVSQYSSESIRLLDEAHQILTEKKLSFHFVTEEALIISLGGLDALVVSPLTLSSQGKRKLQGFCAAGGTILTLSDQLLDLPQEISFSMWVNTLKFY